jgi:thiamine pyrophosphokinase
MAFEGTRLARTREAGFTVAMRALVVANGEPPSGSLLHRLAEAADVVVAADGGAIIALDAGITPDAVVGDLDSVSARPSLSFPPDRLHRITELDTTDLQKAVAFAIDRGATEVDIVAAGGGRADHALANLSVLVTFRGRARIRVHDDLFEISLVDGAATIDAPPGTLISLVAIGPCEGVTTSGMRWDLREFRLTFSPRGVHNEVAAPPATVSVRTGDLLLFRGRWIERHA